MPKADLMLKKIETLLDKLIRNAEKLQEASKQGNSEEDMAILQKQQEQLLNELVKEDEAFQEAFPHLDSEKRLPVQIRIEEKLNRFQHLNALFIDTMMGTSSVIKFEISKLKKHKK